MIHVRMGVADLGRTRFAYSPLAEIAESLHLLSSRQVPPPHQRWYAEVRSVLNRVDLSLLLAAVPPRFFIADFFFAGATGPTTSIDQQLEALAETPIDVLRHDFEEVWRGEAPPAVLRRVLADERGGPRRIADAAGTYWQAAIEPHWSAMRAVLDDDVAYRAGELTKRGVEGLLSDMHPELSVHDDVLRIEKRRHPGYHEDHELGGTGMLLVPSIFVWPNLIFVAGPGKVPSLTYPARGIGNVWGTEPATTDEDALRALIGRSRAAILTALAIPHSTTELALALRQSAPAVSQHLSVLRRSGLVISWRSGRRVLYRRTALATSVMVASGAAHADGLSAGA